MAYPRSCPFCKNGSLSVFDKSLISATLYCSDCDRLVTVKTGTGKLFEAAVPVLSALVSLASLGAFFGIDDFSKIKAWFGGKHPDAANTRTVVGIRPAGPNKKGPGS